MRNTLTEGAPTDYCRLCADRPLRNRCERSTLVCDLCFERPLSEGSMRLIEDLLDAEGRRVHESDRTFPEEEISNALQLFALLPPFFLALAIYGVLKL